MSGAKQTSVANAIVAVVVVAPENTEAWATSPAANGWRR